VKTPSGFVDTVISEQIGKAYVVSTAKAFDERYETAVLPFLPPSDPRSLERLVQSHSNGKRAAAVTHKVFCEVIRTGYPEQWASLINAQLGETESFADTEVLRAFTEGIGEARPGAGETSQVPSGVSKDPFRKAVLFEMFLLGGAIFLASTSVGTPLAIAFAAFLLVLAHPATLAAESLAGGVLGATRNLQIIKHGGYIMGHAAVLVLSLSILAILQRKALDPILFGFLAIASIPEFVHLNAGDVLRNSYVLGVNLLMMFTIYAFLG
jgi:hypothetical protein